MRAVPLTEAQSGLWYAQRLDPANPTFNTGQYLDLRGPLDVEALGAAVDRAGEEAEALSLRFIDAPEGPLQLVDPALRPRLEVVDLSGEDDPERAALASIQSSMATPVSPERGPLAGRAGASPVGAAGPALRDRRIWHGAAHRADCRALWRCRGWQGRWRSPTRLARWRLGGGCSLSRVAGA